MTGVAAVDDDLGAPEIRERVLAAWRAAPDRFREDANAEEDLALGGYRDRAVVELAQNASDAAARAGVPGRLLVRLAETDEGLVLVAASTGAPLDAAGVRGLASLRASGKRDDVGGVGRFGVGFAAVLALTDAPAVLSHGRGVRFSRADSAALVAEAGRDVPGLALELERRDGHVPALRLPFAAQGPAPTGYDTVVVLPLRDPAVDGGAARELAMRLLDEVGDPLLLALPGLDEVVLEVPGRPPRRLDDVGSRWHVYRASGAHAAQDLADRPTEERRRPGWSLAWAVPRDAGVVAGGVLHAPTPTDEPMAWPALLVASFPLEPTRRHVAGGPAHDALVRHAGSAYAALLTSLAADGVDTIPLVPTGLPAGPLDADLRAATLPLLGGAAVLQAVEGGTVRPRDAVALESGADDPLVLAALAPLLAGLVAAPRSATAALAALGVRRLQVADVVEALPSHPDPAWWQRLYAGLVPLAGDPRDREALASLPVPLADGRVVRGVRGLLLSGAGVSGVGVAGDDRSGGEPLAALAAHGLRVVHPAAVTGTAADLLERLGAVPAGARAVLEDAAVRAALDDAVASVEDGADQHEVSDVVDAVLTLVAEAVRAGELEPGDAPWLGDLPLPDADGEPTPAGGLVLAGSPAHDLLDAGEVGVLAGEVAARWSPEVLEAVGVARSLSVVRWSAVDTMSPPDELLDLDGAHDWLDQLPPGEVAEVRCARDLDLVDTAGWPQALALMGREPRLLSALREEVTVTGRGGVGVRAPSYTAWWLRGHLGLSERADPEAEPALAAALPVAPAWVADLDRATRDALGMPRTWSDLDARGWSAALGWSAGVGAAGLATVLTMWRALGRAADRDDLGVLAELELPRQMAALGPQGVVVVESSGAVVVDAPMWLQRHDLGGLVVAPADCAEALADVLDLDLASEVAAGLVDRTGARQRAVPALAASALASGSTPGHWFEHDVLRVDGVDVGWWVTGSGVAAEVHATGLGGLAAGLAQAAGAWTRRGAVEELLTTPAAAPRVLAELALEGD